MSSAAHAGAASANQPCAQPSHHPAPAAQQLAADVEEAAACAGVPEYQRRKPSDGPSWWNLVKTGPGILLHNPTFKNCLVGIVKQLVTEWEGVKHIAQAWWKVGFTTGLANVRRAIYDTWKQDPLLIGVVERAVTGVWDYFVTETVKGISCLNNEEQQVRVCTLLPKVAIAYVTGGILKPAYFVAGKAITGTGSAVGKGMLAATSKVAGTRAGAAVIAKTDAAVAASKEFMAGFSNVPKVEGMGLPAIEAAEKAAAEKAARAAAQNGSLASEIVPQEARAVPPKKGKIRKAAELAQKGAHAGQNVLGKMARAGFNTAPERALSEISKKENDAKPFEANLKSTRAREQAEAEARWKAEHPDGEDEEEYTPDEEEESEVPTLR